MNNPEEPVPHSFLDSIMTRPSFARITVKLRRGEKASHLIWNGALKAPKGQRWETDEELRDRIRKLLAPVGP